MIYSFEVLREFLLAALEQSKEDYKENSRINQNCYGAGYELGRLEMLKEILDEIPDSDKYE